MERAARDFFKDFDVLTHENRNFRSAPESLSHRQGHLLRPPGETIWLVLLTSRSLNGGSRLYHQKINHGANAPRARDLGRVGARRASAG